MIAVLREGTWFNSICFWMNVFHLSWLVAVLRWVVWQIGKRICYGKSEPPMQTYERPESVGYAGWHELPFFGALVFVRRDLSYQFRW